MLYAHVKVVVKIFRIFVIFVSVFLLFLSVILVPELFRELRETRGINFHQVSSIYGFMVSSYDQKTKKVNDYFRQRLLSCERKHIGIFLVVLQVFASFLNRFFTSKNLFKNLPKTSQNLPPNLPKHYQKPSQTPPKTSKTHDFH